MPSLLPLLALGLATAAAGSGAQAADPVAAPVVDTRDALRALGLTQGGVAIVGIELNGRDLGVTAEVALSDSRLMIRGEDLEDLRLVAGGAVVEIAGEDFVPLMSVPGLRLSIDAARQLLRLSVQPAGFEATALQARPNTRRSPDAVMPSASVSYDLTVDHSRGATAYALFLDSGFTNRLGYFENTMLTRGGTPAKSVVRLDTSFVHDDPGNMRRLSIGDSLTHGTSWSPQLRFGGIRYGTDFSLQPGYLYFPTPSFQGSAALPSNVELYIDNVLGYQAPVGEGPFTLNQVPVLAGSGNVSLRVRDATGVERQITSNFYVSTQLLRAGLTDFSIEAGALRANYGSSSFDYQRPFASGSWRRGLNSSLTVELHGEASEKIRSVGGGVSTAFAGVGELGGSFATSNSAGTGTGVLYRAYVARNSRSWSLSAVYQGATNNYRSVGDEYPSDRIHQIIQANIGFNFRGWGSFNAALAQIKHDGEPRSRVISVNYSREIPRFGFLSVYALNSRSYQGKSNTSIGLTFTAAFGHRTSATVSADAHDQRIDVQRTMPDDTGFGYRVSAQRGDVDQQQGELSYRSSFADTTMQVSRFNGQIAERFIASGSVVFAGGELLPAHRLNGSSYAVVDVDGQKGVRVYQDNRLVATTDSKGRAIVTQLRPYEDNRISIAPEDLRLDVSLTDTARDVVPPARSAVMAHFRAKTGRAGSLFVRRPDGSAIPPGTRVLFDNGDATVVGLDGEIFMTMMKTGSIVTVQDVGGACEVVVPELPTAGDLPQVGPLTCAREGGAK